MIEIAIFALVAAACFGVAFLCLGADPSPWRVGFFGVAAGLVAIVLWGVAEGSGLIPERSTRGVLPVVMGFSVAYFASVKKRNSSTKK